MERVRNFCDKRREVLEEEVETGVASVLVPKGTTKGTQGTNKDFPCDGPFPRPCTLSPSTSVFQSPREKTDDFRARTDLPRRGRPDRGVPGTTVEWRGNLTGAGNGRWTPRRIPDPRWVHDPCEEVSTHEPPSFGSRPGISRSATRRDGWTGDVRGRPTPRRISPSSPGPSPPQ